MSGYPTDWSGFDKHMPSGEPSWFGFSADVGTMNRFAARFRLANSFSSISLDDYAESTVEGYSGLFRVLLVWSAFEVYLKTVGLKQSTCEALLDKYSLRNRARQIIKNAPPEYYRFLSSQLKNESQRKGLRRCFNQDDDNVTYLASAVRHIFAHGILSPNAGGASPKEISAVCKEVSDLLIELMDRDFSSYVRGFEARINMDPNERHA